MHRRMRPRRHHFRYRAWWLCLDLEEIEALDSKLRLFSRRRRNLISFHDDDYGHDTSDLRVQIERQLCASDINFDGGPIRLLCSPRVLGYQFNPLSIYFCYRRAGDLAATVYEVHNTFGERHSYCIAARADSAGVVRQTRDKSFYVSPFMGMDMSYDFRLAAPGETLTVGITGSEDGTPLINTVLQAQRQELSDRRLATLLFTHPFVTWKIIAAIHFEAVRLWWKGLAIHPHSASVDAKPAHERRHV
jgi:hypothetical protein